MPSDDHIGHRITDGQVRTEWIDINGHMNVAYYVLAFDLAVDALWATFGIDNDYIRETRGSTFAVECRVTYLRELEEGDSYFITSQILAYDEKRIHQFQRLYKTTENCVAATAEWMNLHVDLDTRRVTAWPPGVLDSIQSWAGRQQSHSMPVEAGRLMRVRNPLYSIDGKIDHD